ncbi:MAG TPA: sugar transferase [Ktedonobacterales bacterium]
MSTRKSQLTIHADTALLTPSTGARPPVHSEARSAEPMALDAQIAWSEPHLLYWPLKRLCDIVTAMIALLFLSVLLIPVALLLFAEDGGPPLYRGEAIGFNGRLFKVFKIRTMRRDADVYFDKHPELKAEFWKITSW